MSTNDPQRCFGSNMYFTYLLTYSLTYSMVQSPSWEANRFAASQEILRILWNPKVNYSFHKCPPPVPILSQLGPVHIMSLFRFLFRTKVSIQVRDKCPRWVIMPFFTERSCQHLAQPPSWRITPCWFPRLFNIIAATLHTGGRSSICNLRTRHAVVTGTHLSRQICTLHEKYSSASCHSK